MKPIVEAAIHQISRRQALSRALLVAASLLVLVVAALPASAQAPAVSATVDRNAIGIDETLTLSIAVEGAGGQPALPPLDDFQVLGTSSGVQMRTVNGNTTTQTVTQYRLQPLRSGELTIPAFQIVVDGQGSALTDPIVVSVTQGSGAPAQAQPGAMPPLFANSGSGLADLLGLVDQMLQNSSALESLAGGQTPVTPSRSLPQIPAPAALLGQDYYAEASVDKVAPYLGEQVLYTLRFFRALDPFGRIEYKAPAFNGAWSKALPDQTDYVTEAGGRRYLVTELQHVLFPMVAGEVVIDPAQLALPGDFLGAPGLEVASNPLTLDVQPLPAGAPAGFRGAVGQFQIESVVDKADAMAGDAVKQRVVISGNGNIEQITEPDWADDAAWRAFDSQSSTDTRFQNGLWGGVRTIERVLVPTQPGQLNVPAGEFSYFDPAAGAYRTISTQPATLTVAPDPSEPVAQTPTEPVQTPASATLAHPELRPIKDSAATQAFVARAPLASQPAFWALWALPMALVAGQTVWQRRQQAKAGALRSHLAARQAHRALRAAGKQPEYASEAAHRILTEYIFARLQRPVTGLTQRALADLLLVHNISPQAVARVQALLTQCEVGRYAPAGLAAHAGDLLAETQQVIDALEQQLS
jgi:hypothetical protein